MTQSNLFELSHFFSAISIKNKYLLFMLFLYIYYLTIAKSQPLRVISLLPTPFSLFPTPYLNCHYSSNMWMWVIIDYFEVFKFKIKNILHL